MAHPSFSSVAPLTAAVAARRGEGQKKQVQARRRLARCQAADATDGGGEVWTLLCASPHLPVRLCLFLVSPPSSRVRVGSGRWRATAFAFCGGSAVGAPLTPRPTRDAEHTHRRERNTRCTNRRHDHEPRRVEVSRQPAKERPSHGSVSQTAAATEKERALLDQAHTRREKWHRRCDIV